MIAETQVGIQNLTIGAKPILRSDRTAATVVVDGHARFQEAVVNNNVFSFSGVTTGMGAGQIVGGSAGGNLNFILWNPVGSGRNLVLWQFGLGIISATTSVVGAVFHGMMNTSAVLSGLPGSVTNVSNTKSVAGTFFVAGGGTAFLGGTVPYTLYMTNFGLSSTTVQASSPISATENIDGKIILVPGMGWLPLFLGVGSSWALHLSVVWEETPA